MEWIKEDLSGEIETLREAAEAEAAKAERRATRKRFRWGSLVGVVALVVVLLLFVPGSPLRVFSASTVTEEVGVVQALAFQEQAKCAFQTQAAGAILAMCLDTVEKLSNDTMRFNVHWTATIRNERFNAVNRKGSAALDSVPYLLDEAGNTYNFLDVGGSAALQVAVGHGQNSDPGWFLFPELADGATTVDLVDLVDGQEIVIQEIALQ